MTIEAVVQGRLLALSAVTSLVSTRIHRIAGPAGVARPYLVWRRIDGVPEPGMGEDSGLMVSRFQFDAYAEDPDVARQLAAAVYAGFKRWRDPAASPEVLDVQVVYGPEMFEPDIEPTLHRVVVDAVVDHRE